MDKAKIRKWLLLIAGISFVGLGALGIFVPLLPTTPFMLLAAGCFIRSSPRMYSWLIHHKLLGSYIRHYHEFHAITMPAKIVTLVFLWGVIGSTAVFAVTTWWLRLLLIAVAVAVTAHILHMKTLTPEMMRSLQPAYDEGDD